MKNYKNTGTLKIVDEKRSYPGTASSSCLPDLSYIFPRKSNQS